MSREIQQYINHKREVPEEVKIRYARRLGFRPTTYGDTEIHAAMCRHGFIVKPDANHHVCSWVMFTKL